MAQLLARLLQWIVRKLGLLLVIVAILLVGSWLKTEWDEHRAGQASLEQQEALLTGLHAELESIDAAIASDQAEWRRKTAERMRALWQELDVIEDSIRALQPRLQQARGEYLDLARQAQAARHAASRAKRGSVMAESRNEREHVICQQPCGRCQCSLYRTLSRFVRT